MNQSFNTFFEDDGEITWCTVYYEADKIGGKPEMFHLSVHTYASGEITEYIPQRWMTKFEEIAWVYYKEEEDRYLHWVELTSDYHQDENIAANHIIKMMQAGISKDEIIDRLAQLFNSAYYLYKNQLAVTVPSKLVAIDFDKLPDFIKDKLKP